MSGSVPMYTRMPPKNQRCLSHVCVPPPNVASVALPRATQACLHVPALTPCFVGVSAMAARHLRDAARNWGGGAEMRDPGGGGAAPAAQRP